MRVAIIGSGGVAQRHLGVLTALSGVAVVGHLSSDAERAAAQAARWGGRGYTRIHELVDREQPQAVWICVTPDQHGALELALIERRIPFFVEKPLSVDLETADTIASAVRSDGPVAAVGYKFRALDTLPRVRALLAERPPRMVIATWHDVLPPPEWWRHAERSGGQIVEQATHLLDLARVLVGEAEVLAGAGGRWPRAVAPDADVPDVSVVLLQFSTVDGPIPGVVSSTSLLAGPTAIHLQLVCEGRALTISERRIVIETGVPGETQELRTRADPFAVEDAAFLDAVAAGDTTRVLCSYADALESHRLACRVRDVLAGAP